jgi:hypothetical protein
MLPNRSGGTSVLPVVRIGSKRHPLQTFLLGRSGLADKVA